MLNLLFNQYFHLRQTIPLVIYVFYLLFQDADSPFIDALSKTALLAIGIFTSLNILGCILGIPIKTLLSFTWTYFSSITWGFFFFSYYYILTQKNERNLASFTMATLATVGGGWLYEVPFFHPISMFLGKGSLFYANVQIMCILLLLFELRKKSFSPLLNIYVMLLTFHPISMLLGKVSLFYANVQIMCILLLLFELRKKSFSPLLNIYVILFSSIFSIWVSFPYPNAQIICLLLLAYELRKRNFKINKLIVSTALLYLAFSIPLYLDKYAFWRTVKDILGSLNYLIWLYRIPASLFLLSLLSGVEKND